MRHLTRDGDTYMTTHGLLKRVAFDRHPPDRFSLVLLDENGERRRSAAGEPISVPMQGVPGVEDAETCEMIASRLAEA